MRVSLFAAAVLRLSWFQLWAHLTRSFAWSLAAAVKRTFGLTIIVQTSKATSYQIDEILRRYKVDLPDVHYFCVIAAGVPHPAGLPVIETPCQDTKDGYHGLVCRDVHAYKYFVARPELGSYLFRAIDDSHLNVTNLLKLISKLNEVYDPRYKIVFRGYANDEYNRIFL
jgi:hypothetical protein